MGALPFVQLLGGVKVNLGVEEVAFLSDKRFFLLAYLALKADWVSRDELVFLFFADTDSVSARKNLRQLLYRMRTLAWVKLEVQNQQIRWLVKTDVAEFQSLISSNRYLEALDVYQGQFLSGLNLDLPEFSNWLDLEREGLHSAYKDAALVVAKQLVAESNFILAQKICFQVLTSDPLSEDMLQVLLGCAVQTKTKHEALRAFKSFQTTLKQDLNLLPLETTLQLAAELQQQESTPVVPLKKAKLQNIAAEANAFVGREMDLSEIESLLAQPHVRLLTLIGAGGMGKTRLSIEVAREQGSRFADGAVFVPLANLTQPSGIAAAIAAAVTLPMVDAVTQVTNLKNYLSDKHLLLVLDNFEHLIDGADLVLELLNDCPDLKVLITSRQALDFQQEHLVDVMGLDVPQDALGAIELFDSVQLLLRSAKRVNPRFILKPEDKTFVVQICQMLQGSPLSIELAAHWLRSLSPEEVTRELQTSLDFLTVNQPDVPLRHRSLQAVFDSSWVLLSAEQQRVLAQLSLLPNGFTLQSATHIAKTNPTMLMVLVSKSLISRNQTRFVIHETIRQYAALKLEPDQKAAALLELSVLAKNWAEAVYVNESTPKDFASVQNFEDEFENITLALEWSFTHQPLLCAEIVYLPLFFWYASARNQTGIQWLTKLLELPFTERHAIRANLLCTRSILKYAIQQPESGMIDALEALEIAQAVGNKLLEAQVLIGLSVNYFLQGLFNPALEGLQKVLELNKNVSNNNLEANALNFLGIVYHIQDELELSMQTFQKLMTRTQVTGNKRGFAHATANLARVYGSQGNVAMQQLHLEQATALYQEAKDTTNLCGLLLDLTDLVLKRNSLPYAKNTLLQAAEPCLKVQLPSFFVRWFGSSAKLMHKQGLHEKALRLYYVCERWMEQPVPGEDLDVEQSAKLFQAEKLAQFQLEAGQYSPKQAMQYAMQELEVMSA